MKTYKRISPKIGHVSNFKAIDDKDAAKQMKEWNDYQGHYGKEAYTFEEVK